MREEFTFGPLPTRVVFGRGAVKSVRDEVVRAGFSRVLVLSSPGHAESAERLAADLGELAVGVHPHAVVHVPADVADRARAAARDLAADGCVAIGGGSAIGLAKAVALDGPPFVAVPTTYAGSEMTPVWGLTADGHKRTGRDERVRPRTVVYDPDLTDSLPVAVSVTSGMNALAHAVEALYAPDASPVVSLLAAEGVRALTGALPALVHDPGDPVARAAALYGAWLCGTCLGATTMGLHHKLCHTLGGSFDLPHAGTHTVVLPHVLAYNAPAAPAAAAVLGEALGTDDPALALWELAGTLGAPRSLRELGLTDDDVDRAVELATADPYANPAPVTADGLRALLRAALDGHPPVGG
ncbi:MAG TPA: maleylacetate reductase [Mycobacteriales bacterium]|jgi:maleylacetate reductase|nr:maleylacetate reductase [Mycobacteriales bacterium]